MSSSVIHGLQKQIFGQIVGAIGKTISNNFDSVCKNNLVF